MRVALLALAFALVAPPALAQDDGEPPPLHARPTSGEASLFSGRTLGVGETMVAGGVGWPGLFAMFQHAVTSSFNLGARAGLTYGSPMMALVPAVGAELGAPIRIHLYGEGDVDLAAYLEPVLALSEGAAAGELGTVYAGDLGWSSRLELGAVLGLRVQERLTLLAGAGGHVGFVHVPAAGDPTVVGAALARFGIEGLISRDTMLFAVIDGGIGFAADRGPGAPVFDAGLVSGLFRVALGLGYLL
ncbi:MAG: hypothetical protein KF729_29230 [Sandaracinaceae bacterium]|nr:hypothetical protein [Sandaracinaceae bacterium]